MPSPQFTLQSQKCTECNGSGIRTWRPFRGDWEPVYCDACLGNGRRLVSVEATAGTSDVGARLGASLPAVTVATTGDPSPPSAQTSPLAASRIQHDTFGEPVGGFAHHRRDAGAGWCGVPTPFITGNPPCERIPGHPGHHDAYSTWMDKKTEGPR